MAAAYAAVLSLMNTIQLIQNHPRPPISLDKFQVESLTAKLNFLQQFLECYSHVADELQSRIKDAAYAAEDVIECHIVDRIDAVSTRVDPGEEGSSDGFYEALQTVIQDMDLIKTEVMEMRGKMRRNYSPGSSMSPSTTHNRSMVGFDDVLKEMVDKLTRTDSTEAGRQIIPIIGMAGIGKTTLARNVYVDPLIQHHFDIRAWATISQEYNTLKILREVLCLVTKERKEHFNDMSEDELCEMLYKHLSCRRYLIILDDMWSIEAWDKIKFFFPDFNDGSRIIITTRLSDLAFQLSGSYGVKMKLLDEDKSWDLFRSVFEGEGCPEEIGNKIVRACKGLPLSIVVVGGLLSKSKDIQEYWEYVAENLSSVVNLDENKRCLKILHMSYNELPIYLKPCFLYVGVFPEDEEIRVSRLVKLWIAEGFLKPIDGTTLEMVAEEYLKELIDRNLISVHTLGSNGKTKLCKIHDLLRDLCLKEAHKEKFLFVAREHDSRNIPEGGIDTKRRICIHEESENPSEVIHALETSSRVRSFISDSIRHLPWFCFRLLRVSSIVDDCLYHLKNPLSPEADTQQVNLRYLAVEIVFDQLPIRFPPSICFFWNLQTLIVDKVSLNNKVVQFHIWSMSPLLRHIKFNTLELQQPTMNEESRDTVLENLQTLCSVFKLRLGDEVVKRIPNIKKLQLHYDKFVEGYSLNNLGRLHKLESLGLAFEVIITGRILKENITFPHSLKKLTLHGTSFCWEEIMAAIGSLPRLEVLKLHFMSFVGPEWETIEGQFCSLKFLQIADGCLRHWTTESGTHFPRLERLVLVELNYLEEIPSSIGDIPTLQLISLRGCPNSAADSAKRIQEQQEELGNFDLKVVVHSVYHEDEDEKLEILQTLRDFGVLKLEAEAEYRSLAAKKADKALTGQFDLEETSYSVKKQKLSTEA